MGLYNRVKDIVQSNLHGALDEAERPDKLVSLMVREMEEALIDIKAGCAEAMADKHRLSRALEESRAWARSWETRAELAVEKGREDLGREALIEKHRYLEEVKDLENDLLRSEKYILEYKDEMGKLDKKLKEARANQRVIVQRYQWAKQRKQAGKGIRRFETSGALRRYEQFMDRMEASHPEAELLAMSRYPDLEEKFWLLENEDRLKQELEALKERVAEETNRTESDEDENFIQ